VEKIIIPNDVGILGDVNDWGRRNYPKLWADLMEALKRKEIDGEVLNGHC
jgi:hypothetical protein